MALVVESGSGLVNAESYASVAEADAYLAAFRPSTAWTAATTDAKEQRLRQATQWLDNKFSWKGRKYTKEQALDWPRSYVQDSEGFDLDVNVIPTDLKRATIEAAVRALAGELDPDFTAGRISSLSESVGPISRSVSYIGGQEETPSYSIIEKIVKDLTESSWELKRS